MSGLEESGDNQSSFDDDSYSEGGTAAGLSKKNRSAKQRVRPSSSQNAQSQPAKDPYHFDERETNTRQTRKKQTNGVRSLLQQEKDVDMQILEAEEEEKAEALANADPDEQITEQGGIFFPEIDLILWRRQKEAGQPGEFEYLVKYKDYSYLHCEWLEESEVIGDSKAGKNKLNRFLKTFQKKQQEEDYDIDSIENEKYFDQTYIEVDRVLQCTEVFPIIHPKKSNEIKGKWSELLAIITQKLLNFTKDDVNYGIYFMEPVNPERDNCPNYKRMISSPMDLGTLNNRLYLDYYQSFQHFFNEFGLVFKNCRVYNQNAESDIRILCDTLREAAIVLYREWHAIEKRRYDALIKEFNLLNDPEFIRKREEEKRAEQQRLSEKRRKEFQKQTVLLTKKLMDIQRRQKEYEEEKAGKTEQTKTNEEAMQIENDQTPKEPNSNQFNLMEEIKVFAKDFSEQVSQNIILKDIDLKEEHEAKNVMNIFIQANKFLLDIQFPEEPSEPSAEQGNTKTDETAQKPQDVKAEDPSAPKDNQDNETISSKEELTNKLVDSLVLTAKNRRRKGGNPELSYEEIEKYNPGKFSYGWLCDEGDTSANVEDEPHVYLSEEEVNGLSFTVEVDMLYLVKWRNLSYLESTWEHESVISNPSKITDYKYHNRALDKESRQILSQQLQRHNTLLDVESNPKKKSKLGPNGLTEIKNKLYSYDIGLAKQPFQYTQKNQPIYKQRKLLRYYQLDSLNWMIEAFYNNRNLILADEMGLGKTIQSTAFINHLYTFENVRGPFLIVAPLSTLEHWKRSVDDWTSLNAVLYYDHAGQDGRTCCRNYEWHYTDISTKGTVLSANEIYKFQVIITSNEVFLNEAQQVLMQIPFQFIVVDEAHRLKNQNAKILSALKSLPCKRTLLLTGTPIQNNTEELWTLLNYIEPSKFSSLQLFKNSFGELQNKEQVDDLQAKIKPYLLRRMKEDVEDSIPPLQETIIDIEMTTLQKTLYRAIYERNKSMLQKSFSTVVMNTSLNNLEMQLRKCCNHPFLIKEIEFELTHACADKDERFKKLIDTSGKMILLDKLVMKYKQEGKKILIFSQFVYVLVLLEEYLRYRGYKYEKIDGSVKSKERQNSIDRFNDPEKKRDVFLLSTKAGGLGINLTSANIVIIFDSDWNPQNDVQATARAHRIGQKQEVMVYRFITKKTYEAEMFERATKKLGLDQAIFMGGEFKSAGASKDDSKKLGKQDVENLLKKGILGLVNEEEENKKSNEFFEEDIDQILKNNTRIAKYSVINGSYSFSKGSFVSNQTDSNLKIDDPNFWSKVLKDQESKTLLALKEYEDRAKILALDQDEQKIFFFKICEFVNDLISSKLSLIGYNADDEKNVLDILVKIQSNRDFQQKYKDLAMTFTYEVARPSRRFRKMQMQDLEVSSIDPIKNFSSGIKNGLGDQIDENELFYEGDSDGGADFDINGAIGEQTSEKKSSVKEPKEPGSTTAGPVCRKEDIFKKLCYHCDRPKCSQFCQGHCRRCFHSECKDIVEAGWINENGMSEETRVEPTEEHYDDEKLRKMANNNFICKDCSNDLAICFICKKKSSYFPASVLNKQTKGKSNVGDGGQIEVEEEEVSSSEKKSELTKCSTANCNKFYHPDCIKGVSLFKYIDSNNKRFRCPLHYCAMCLVSGDSMAIAQCVRCPKAYHLRCFNLAKVTKLTKKLMICENHAQDGSLAGIAAHIDDYAEDDDLENAVNEPQIKKKQKGNNGNSTQNNNSSNGKKTNNNTKNSNGNGASNNDNPSEVNKNVAPEAEETAQVSRSRSTKTRSARTSQQDLSLFFAKKQTKSTEKTEEKQVKSSKSLQEGEEKGESLAGAEEKGAYLEASEKSKAKVRKPPVVKDREKPQFSYEDFKIPCQKDFDYDSYGRDWCRYCGARFSSNFTKGPWGPRTLCTVHYIAWNQKKKLDLRAYKTLPTRPINPDDQTELHFMSRLKIKDDSYHPEELLKEMMAVGTVQSNIISLPRPTVGEQTKLNGKDEKKAADGLEQQGGAESPQSQEQLSGQNEDGEEEDIVAPSAQKIEIEDMQNKEEN